jgi:hypothetical protein
VDPYFVEDLILILLEGIVDEEKGVVFFDDSNRDASGAVP